MLPVSATFLISGVCTYYIDNTQYNLFIHAGLASIGPIAMYRYYTTPNTYLFGIADSLAYFLTAVLTTYNFPQPPAYVGINALNPAIGLMISLNFFDISPFILGEGIATLTWIGTFLYTSLRLKPLSEAIVTSYVFFIATELAVKAVTLSTQYFAQDLGLADYWWPYRIFTHISTSLEHMAPMIMLQCAYAMGRVTKLQLPFLAAVAYDTSKLFSSDPNEKSILSFFFDAAMVVSKFGYHATIKLFSCVIGWIKEQTPSSIADAIDRQYESIIKKIINDEHLKYVEAGCLNLSKHNEHLQRLCIQTGMHYFGQEDPDFSYFGQEETEFVDTAPFVSPSSPLAKLLCIKEPSYSKDTLLNRKSSFEFFSWLGSKLIYDDQICYVDRKLDLLRNPYANEQLVEEFFQNIDALDVESCPYDFKALIGDYLSHYGVSQSETHDTTS